MPSSSFGPVPVEAALTHLAGEELLVRLARLLTDAFLGSGFGEQRFVLIHTQHVEGTSGDFDLGIKNDLDGHPVDALLGFVCPEHWTSFGCSQVGWSSPVDGGIRPSLHPERQRVRITSLIDRAGTLASAIAYENGRVTTETSECVGMVPDVLRRCIGVPTPPPDMPTYLFSARLWMEAVIREARRGPMSWKKVAAMRPDTTGESWADLRWSVVTGRRSLDEVDAEIAAWMDDGMFARWVFPDGSLISSLRKAVGDSHSRRLLNELSDQKPS